MDNHYKHLKWDSDFFGFNVFMILENLDEKLLGECIEELLKKKGAKLIYYSPDSRIKDPGHIQKDCEIYLADEKVTFAKTLQKHDHIPENIVPYNKKHPEKSLINLAIQSGTFSRFKIDPRIDNDKFEKLYELWISNSAQKKIAKEVLVYHESNEIAGFVTLGEKNNIADVGLISVDLLYRGRGIGKSLMLAAENWFMMNTQHKKIQVVTQSNNTPACALYRKLNFLPTSITYFYHIWSKTKI